VQDLHFQPSELWEMDAEELFFWLERRREIVQRTNKE